MCGIAGIISDSAETLAKINAATDLVNHRGPDGRGVYIQQNLAFGHRRLSILDLSELGKQPMSYVERYVITYNGEVYNYLEIREDLRKKGYQFKSDSDTEVILAAYAEWGQDCLHRFNGMFSFAIYDQVKQTVFCARDRFGVKPFYYLCHGTDLYFGSEIKQFTVLPGWSPTLNKKKAVDFLVNDIIDRDEHTFFEQVKQLRGGCFLYYDLQKKTFEVKKWYSLEAKQEYQHLTEEEALRIFKDLFTDAVSLRLRSDVKVGSCLSGGLDSSSIVSVVNRLLKAENKSELQEVVSACFNEKKYDEQIFIDKLVAEKNIAVHKVFPDINDLFPDLDKMLWHQDEPFGSTSIFAQWSVFKEARKNGLIVMLDGQGADEILGGYHTFLGPYILGALKKGKLLTGIKRMRVITANGHSTKWIIKEVYKNAISSRRKIKLQNIRANRFKYIDQQLLTKYLDDSTYKNFKDMSRTQILASNLPMLLHFEDRDSMAFSVESRVPFLDYRVVEFCYSVDEDLLIKGGITKHILRESMKDILPSAIKDRKDKMGFVTPEKLWLKDHAAAFKKELSEAVAILNPVVNSNVLDLFDRIIADRAAFDFTPWKVIVLGRWAKIFNVSIK